jgi:hypothetical protein
VAVWRDRHDADQHEKQHSLSGQITQQRAIFRKYSFFPFSERPSRLIYRPKLKIEFRQLIIIAPTYANSR